MSSYFIPVIAVTVISIKPYIPERSQGFVELGLEEEAGNFIRVSGKAEVAGEERD